MDPVQKISFVPQEFLWLVEVAFGLLMVTFFSLLARKILKVKDGKGRWSNVQRIAYLPTQVAILGIGISLILDVLSAHFGLTRISLYIHHIAQAFVVVCFCWIALRWVRIFFEGLYTKTDHLGINGSTLYALRKLTSIVVLILSLLIFFQIFGLNIMPLLAFGGIGMAGIAFAAQDIVANFFGGVMLHFAHPFEPGDFIEVPSQNNFTGRVEEIGWYGTVLRDSDKRQVFFPNALFTKTNVINLSRRTHCRITEKIPLNYQNLNQVAAFVDALREKIAAHPKIDRDSNFYVALMSYGANAFELHIDILTYETNTADVWQVKQEILLLTKRLAESFEIEILPMSYVMNYSEK